MQPPWRELGGGKLRNPQYEPLGLCKWPLDLPVIAALPKSQG